MSLEQRLIGARERGEAALLPYLVAGRPTREGFADVLVEVARHAEIVEIGLPFSDPVADGPVIAEAARRALADGVDLTWLLETVRNARASIDAGLVLMTYFNPLLAGGLAANLERISTAGFDGLIVPDVPLEESDELRELADRSGLELIQLVTPLTPAPRARRIADVARGFLYAVTRTGITGARAGTDDVAPYLDGLRAISPVPVCAGFGIRDAEQVRSLAPHADGLIVGTALVETLERGESPTPFLLRLTS